MATKLPPLQSPLRELGPPARLPQPGSPPKRSLSPSAQKILSGSGSFRLNDDDTPARNDTAALYATLIASFDSMTQPARVDLAEIAGIVADLSDNNRRVALIAMRKLAGR